MQGDNRELQFTIWESLKAVWMKDLNQDSWVTPQTIPSEGPQVAFAIEGAVAALHPIGGRVRFSRYARTLRIRTFVKLETLVAGGSVDQLTENVGVPAVSRVLLDHVEIYPTKINRFATGTRLLHELF